MPLLVDARSFDREVACIAGRKIGEVSGARGPGCFCTITRSEIAAHTDPSSLKFCMGEYQNCPVWRAHKEAVWAEREHSFLDAAAGVTDGANEGATATG